MAQALAASMVPGLDLFGTYTIRLTALDATTGAVVTAVKVSSLVITVVTVNGPVPSTDGFTVTPLLTFTPGVT